MIAANIVSTTVAVILAFMSAIHRGLSRSDSTLERIFDQGPSEAERIISESPAILKYSIRSSRDSYSEVGSWEVISALGIDSGRMAGDG